MFGRKEAPYLFTVLIGLCGFFFNQIIGNIKAAPILEYEFKVADESNIAGSKKLLCMVSNISESIKFDSIAVVMKYSKEVSNRLFNPDCKPIHPANLDHYTIIREPDS